MRLQRALYICGGVQVSSAQGVFSLSVVVWWLHTGVTTGLLRNLSPQAFREASRLCRGWVAEDFLISDLGSHLYLWGQAERNLPLACRRMERT